MKTYIAVFLHKSHIWENFVPKIWAKMFLAIQFVGFCNQPYLQNKVSQVTRLRNWLYLKNELMEWTDILHAGAIEES